MFSLKEFDLSNFASTSKLLSSIIVIFGAKVTAGRPAEPSSEVAGVPSNPTIMAFQYLASCFLIVPMAKPFLPIVPLDE